MKLRAKKRPVASSTSNLLADEYIGTAGRYTQGGDAESRKEDEDERLVKELAERNVRTQGAEGEGMMLEGNSRNYHVSSHY